MSKIVLIDCEVLPSLRTDHYEYPVHTEPLGLEYLAAYIIENGHEVSIVQLPLSEENKIKICKADMVGFSVLTYQWNVLKETVRLAKNINPQATLVAGREHPTALPKMCLDEIPELDYIICGEGEIPLLQLANGNCPEKILGIAYRKDGNVIVNPRPERLKNWPNPIREKEKMTVTLVEWTPLTHKSAGLMISRGCPFNCDFCTKEQMWGKKYYYQQIGKTIDEIIKIQQNYSVNFFAFHDLMFPPKFLEPFCSHIFNRKINAFFFTMMSITPHLIDWKMIKDAGFMEIGVGLEIPTDRRKEIGKIHSFQLAKKFINSIALAGILIRLYLVIGWPHERNTKEVIEIYTSALREIPAHFLRIHFLVPFPGTEIWERHKKNFIFPIPDGFNHFTTMEPTLCFNIKPKELIYVRKKIIENYYNSSNFYILYKELNKKSKEMVDIFLAEKNEKETIFT